jgi:hypothetical protein
MKKIHLLLILLICLMFNAYVFADSPLTSTPFYTAYKHIPAVKYASEKGLDKKTLKFLNSDVSSDQKLAVLNALSWGNTNNVLIYENYLIKKNKKLDATVFTELSQFVDSENEPSETDNIKKLSADEMMCWAYLQAMGDYFNPSVALRASYFAFMRNESNMAYGTLFTLIAAQVSFDINWCNVYLIGKMGIVDTQYSTSILNQDAVKIIMDYLRLYEESCED